MGSCFSKQPHERKPYLPLVSPCHSSSANCPLSGPLFPRSFPFFTVHDSHYNDRNQTQSHMPLIRGLGVPGRKPVNSRAAWATQQDSAARRHNEMQGLTVAHACHPRPQEAEAGRSQFTGHPWFQNKLKTGLGYSEIHLKNENLRAIKLGGCGMLGPYMTPQFTPSILENGRQECKRRRKEWGIVECRCSGIAWSLRP